MYATIKSAMCIDIVCNCATRDGIIGERGHVFRFAKRILSGNRPLSQEETTKNIKKESGPTLARISPHTCDGNKKLTTFFLFFSSVRNVYFSARPKFVSGKVYV